MATAPQGADEVRELREHADFALEWLRDRDRGTTHYEGCERVHAACAAELVVQQGIAALERVENLEAAHSELAARWARRAVRATDPTAKYEIRRCISELAIATDYAPAPAPQQGGTDE